MLLNSIIYSLILFYVVFYNTISSYLSYNFIYFFIVFISIILFRKEVKKFVNDIKIFLNSNETKDNNEFFEYQYKNTKEDIFVDSVPSDYGTFVFYLNMFDLKEGYSKSELKSSFRKLAKENHPDINNNPKHDMKDINEGYSFLKSKLE